MFKKLFSSLFEKKEKFDYNAPITVSNELKLAITVLLVELSAADHEISGFEGEMVVGIMKNFLQITDDNQITDLVSQAVTISQDKAALGNYLSMINEECTVDQKVLIYSMCCRIVASDDDVADEERRVLARIRTQLRLNNTQITLAEEAAGYSATND